MAYNSQYNAHCQDRPCYGTAAYLLGLEPMPPPHPEEIVAIVMTNHLLNNPLEQNLAPEDENIDLQLHGFQPPAAIQGEPRGGWTVVP